MRSAMFSGKRRLVTGIIAASLLVSMVAETGQSPAAAQQMSSTKMFLPLATETITALGPTCSDPGAATITLVAGAGTTVTLTCSQASISPTPTVSPTPTTPPNVDAPAPFTSVNEYGVTPLLSTVELNVIAELLLAVSVVLLNKLTAPV